ncbi:MAG: alpha/beta hydrolase [Bacillota bacterium]|nr:alpha/beta hydrolase [Bacillota bacterium]
MATLQLGHCNTRVYRTTDAGKPPIVFLHGWTGANYNWKDQRSFFRASHNIITLDFRGHGHSSKQHGLTLEMLAQDIQKLLIELNLRDVVMVGHSMGALVMFEYIKQFGQGLLSKICIIDQSPRLLTDSEWKLGIYGNFDTATNDRFTTGLQANFHSTMLSFDRNGLRDDLLQLAQSYQGPYFFPDWLIPDVMTDLWQSIINCDYREVLPLIDLPTLLAYGAHSQFYPNETAQYMQKTLKNSHLEVFLRSRHSPQMEEPELFNQTLNSFLSSE